MFQWSFLCFNSCPVPLGPVSGCHRQQSICLSLCSCSFPTPRFSFLQAKQSELTKPFLVWKMFQSFNHLSVSFLYLFQCALVFLVLVTPELAMMKARVQLVHQNLQVFFYKSAFHPLDTEPILVHGVFPARVQRLGPFLWMSGGSWWPTLSVVLWMAVHLYSAWTTPPWFVPFANLYSVPLHGSLLKLNSVCPSISARVYH